ncbi:hypothetical protein [Amycolatopsis sp. FDAARGOS 1241]|uniref:hypothetical protein n=1 Tax=Amycolatopsis sp. FDAARGOS 1241 TaxID=2778070 RepID=UPI0019527E3E|nr:hypothetical protein [Amycolatopsis sp. FDAARGOS 1241]QRP48976.1 hypothetical protein I6J71_14925 [Amycolatopsis sp. FDAARGOS 1241]
MVFKKPRDWALDLALALTAGIALLAVMMVAVVLATGAPCVADAPERPQEPKITAPGPKVQDCQTRELAKARDITGEHEVRVDWVTPEAANRELQGEAAGWTEPGRVVIVTDTPCEYVAAVAAHEFGHVAQNRSAGSIPQAYWRYGAKEMERVAQCFATAFDLHTYEAYGVTVWTDCTGYEKAAASELLKWVR